MSADTEHLPSFALSDSSECLSINRTTADLAASCHIVPAAAEQIARMLFADDHRFPGRSPGVQVDTLAQHCKAALTRKAIRDGLLIVCIFIAIVLPLLGVIAAVLIVVFEQMTSYRIARRLKMGSYPFTAPELRAQFSANERRSLDAIKAAQAGNVNVYSGFEPFVDAGSTLGGWSFAISLLRGKSTLETVLTPKPFDTAEAYARLTTAIEDLAVPGSSVSNVVCANGRELRTNRTLLPDIIGKPVCFVSPAFATALIDASDEQARLYKLVRVEAWSGELVFSMYFRLRKQAGTLFVEASFLVLPPLNERFRVLEHMDSVVSFPTTVREIGRSIIATPFFTLAALRLPLSAWPRFYRAAGLEEAARKRALRNDPLTDYGCRQTLRSWAASRNYRSYFQKLDKEMFVKTIERRLLDSLERLLDEKDIDTSDIRARQDAILNSGVIVSGNRFEASNVSIGRKVQNLLSKPPATSTPSTVS